MAKLPTRHSTLLIRSSHLPGELSGSSSRSNSSIKKREAKNGCLFSQEWTTRRAIILEVLLEGSACNALEEEEEQGDI
jgi:hypothetical protein